MRRTTSRERGRIDRPDRPGSAPVDRASPADLVVLAADRAGGAPEQIGVVLLLDAHRSAGDLVARTLVERVAAVPRLRQRLQTLPPGLGRPIWLDDEDFEASRHVRVQRLPGPLGEPAVLALATTLVTARLPRSAPLWTATVATGTTAGRIAVVLVLHHAIADGVDGLAVLDRLLDGGDGPQPHRFPRPRPTRRLLAVDAARAALRTVRGLPGVVREMRVVAVAGAGSPAVPCSLWRSTGPRRRFGVARVDLAALSAFAHRHGGTVNDALLAVVAGALRTFLAGRGERADVIRAAVVVSGHRQRSADRPGNITAPVVVDIAADRPPGERVHRIAGVVRALRAGPLSGGPVVVLQGVYRVIARLGLYRFYLGHQRRMHTLVSNLRGPDRPRHLAGAPVREVIPLSVGEAGNMTVQFVALSYGDRLTVTAVADPEWTPDFDVLVQALQSELDRAAAGREVRS